MICYKTEIKPTEEQKQKIKQSIGICRYIYNFYLARNKEIYESGGKFLSAYDFDKWLNNEYLPNNPNKMWIKECSSVAKQHSERNAEVAFKNFFKGKSKYPKFKKKSMSDVKLYFVRHSAKETIHCERHRIKITGLGWVRLKQYGYLPTNLPIISGTVSIRAGRYFVSVMVEDEQYRVQPQLNDEGIGIDLGLKDFAIMSDGRVYKNINKTKQVKKLEKKLKREQRCLSRKYEAMKKLMQEQKETFERKNIQKQVLKIQRLNYRLDCIRTNYINQTIADVVKSKPRYVTIENLNVSGMMKNRHLSKAVAQQNFYTFRQKLTDKCHRNGIEVRVVDRFYPSSKTCHNCGCIKHDLKLSDRVYKCFECGYEIDRDLNASLNLRDCETYTVA